ncbi:hypothetical protein EYF80_015688 [Liparis tanakae]|uniref:Uncharacterized protein n=1 Tax=Liparis tanakae TaxID=230148 RepID=A0A4Z2I7M2_9TELE|nr:hypothetical protein EYF80_015688 [Liparis tanakae]
MLHTAHAPPRLNGQDEDFKVRRLRVAFWLPGVAEIQADFRVGPHALTLTERLMLLTVDGTDQDLTRQQLDGERQTGRDTQLEGSRIITDGLTRSCKDRSFLQANDVLHSVLMLRI